MKHRTVVLCVLTLLAGLSAAALLAKSPQQAPVRDSSATLEREKFRAATKNPVKDRYIVILTRREAGPLGKRSRAFLSSDRLAEQYGFQRINERYTHVVGGFSAEMTETVARRLSRDYRVALVLQERVLAVAATQFNPGWGLDRIDQAYGLNNEYEYFNTAAGVRIYIVDTGIRTTHVDFGGRAFLGAVFLTEPPNIPPPPQPPPPGYDCVNKGHGTAVASLAGGGTYGIAKAATLIDVHVGDCSGANMTDIASGINWVIQDVQNHNGPAVINVSIGGDKDALGGAFVETAVRNAINAGITVVVAAGNDDMDARENIPAMVGEAITVGATASDDSRAVFGLGRSSNYGPVLDLFAPGGLVPMAYAESDTAGTVNSGTSFSSPYVAGLAARYLEHYPDAIPWQVADAIVSHATQVVIGDAGPGSPNRLAYSRFLDFNPPPPQPPLHQGGGRKMVMAAVTGMSSIPVPTNASRHSVDGKRDLTAVTGTRMIRVPTSAMKMAKYQSGGGNWVPKAASGIPKMMGRISALLRRPHPIHRWRRRRLLH